MDVLLLLFSLGIILASSEVFTNGIENFGDRLGLSQAVVGSVLAAVGTALPETIVPLVAILSYKGETGAHIGVGAILGAPFMLSTMGLFLVGLGVFVGYFFKTRKTLKIHLETHTFFRDVTFFLTSYSLAIFLPLLFPRVRGLHIFLALMLLLNYALYLKFTFGAESSELESDRGLYFSRLSNRILRKSPSSKPGFLLFSFFQVIVALFVMIEGAHLFVESLEHISYQLHIDPMLFALIIAPIATELPEKCNSFLWTLREKDVLALGNMTGAMVFQSTFPVSIGILFTPWYIHGLALASALITLGLTFFYLIFVKLTKTLPPYILITSGIAYLAYVFLVLRSF